MDTWNKLMDSCQRAKGLQDGMKEDEEINQKMYIHNTDNSVVMARGKGGWELGEDGQMGGGMGTEGDFAWGNGCTMQYTDDVLFSRTLETCRVL